MYLHRLTLGLLTILALSTAGSAHAGSLYGTVRLNQAPLGGARLLLACPSFAARQSSAEVATDPGGSFAIRSAANGRCEMRVQRGTQTGPPFVVFLSPNPSRLDITVDGALVRTSR